MIAYCRLWYSYPICFVAKIPTVSQWQTMLVLLENEIFPFNFNRDSVSFDCGRNYLV